ncbi:MAG: DNA helicase RecQ [Anaerovorax sp.]
MKNKFEILEQYFGYTQFREGQELLIDTILSGRDVAGIMPTGAGKSLCFQVPALLLPGITLVISPLISLMKDQVNALVQNGVPAAYLNSSLTAKQYQSVLKKAYEGTYKIIYVAPERLFTEEIKGLVEDLTLSMVTIDEAHCVSQWGQDFRPSYLEISKFIKSLTKRPVVSAFTATATPKVREDMLQMLELENPYVLLTGFDRKNLYFEVQKPKDKTAAVLEIVSELKDKSGIIYCSTRKNVEEVCAVLCENGYEATRYHAGLKDEERKQNQEEFLFDKCTIMVATNAFGMGIDKSNVSFVIHYNMPKDLESYYQEAGRGGRDGEDAICILLYSGKDVVTNQFLLNHGEDHEAMDEETRELVQQQGRERLKAMTFYCHTNACLRTYILNYFGETSPNFCGNCFNCNHHFEELDITIPAQKILSCVKRTGERYGVKLITDVLRGSENERILKLGLNQQTTHGLLADMKETRVREIINYLVLESYLTLTDDQYPILILGKRAREILTDRIPVTMKLAKEVQEKEKIRKDGKDVHHKGQNPILFQQLRALRTKIATTQRVPAYVVFTNAALEDMCAKLPETLDEFAMVNGVGKNKLDKYGEPFLEIIRTYKRS